MLRMLFFSGLLLSVTPALAQTPPANNNAQQASNGAKDNPDRIICETQEQIGSRIASKKICMTASQWKEHEAAVHSQLDQQKSTVQGAGGPG